MDETTKTAEAPAKTPNPVTCFTEALRTRWDTFSFQSDFGHRALQIILSLSVLLSLSVAVNFGLDAEGSLLRDFFRFLSGFFAEAAYILLFLEVLLAVIFLFSPTFASLLCAVTLYACYASVSPYALFAAMLIFLMFMPEERTVLALMIALPVLCFSTKLSCGLFLTVWAAFVSTRKNNGTVKTMSFVYYALLGLCRGSFGPVTDSTGLQVFPAAADGTRVAESLRAGYALWAAGQGIDAVLLKLLIPLVIFFLIGLVFAKLLNLRFKPHKLPLNILDGVCFSSLALLLCSLPYVLPTVTELKEFDCSVVSILVQVIAAYLVTRPVAGPSPFRGSLPARTFKHYIFISYAHLDLDQVKPCLDILRDRGYDFWYDNAITTGSAWREIIAGNLASCTCFIAFVSKTSIKSDYCMNEINYAISKKKPIALIRLDDTALPPTIEMFLASMQAVQRYKLPSDEACMDKATEQQEFGLCRRD